MVLIGVVVLLSVPAAAGAAELPPAEDGLSALWQYRETLPTGSGPVLTSLDPATAAGSSETPVPLLAIAEERLEQEGGADAARLQKLATMPRFGAPQETLLPTSPATSATAPRGPSTLDAALGTASTDGASHLLGLLVLLAAITAALCGAAFLGVRPGAVVVPLVAAGVFLIALDGGSYSLASRTSLAIAVWWTIVLGVAVGFWPRARVPRAAFVTGGLLAGLALLTGLSVIWAENAEKAVYELDRVVLYLGIYALAVLAVTRKTLRLVGSGVALGIVGVAILALASRFFPDLASADAALPSALPSAVRRLSYPVNYWNGLAALTALALPPLLWLAGTAGRAVYRGAWIAPFPALAVVVYLTSSRGGSLAALAGVVVFVCLTGQRWTACWGAVAGGLGSTAALALLLDFPELVDPPAAATGAGGATAALAIAAICAATGAVYAVGRRLAPAPPRIGVWGRRALLTAVLVVAVAGVVAAAPAQRLERFKEPPPNLAKATVDEHLFAGSGSGRWQLWRGALDEFESRPAVGGGAGSYEAWWAEHGTRGLVVRDAHSLYLQTLAELGAGGLALLLACFGAGLGAGLLRLRTVTGERRVAAAALSAAFVAFALGAAVDWLWELTVVAVVAIGVLGLLTGPATATIRAPRPLRLGSVPLRVAVVALGLLLIGGQALPLLAETRVRASQAAVARVDGDAALVEARAARRLAPWASSPILQLALVEELRGEPLQARRLVLQALRRDRSDWALWLVAARLETKLGLVPEARASLARAVELNPRSPLLARLEQAGKQQ